MGSAINAATLPVVSSSTTARTSSAHRRLQRPSSRHRAQRSLVRLRAAADEESLLLARDRGEIYELLGQPDLVLYQVQRRGVKDFVHLALYGLCYLGHGVPADRGHDPAEEVQVLVALRIPHPETLAAHQLQRPLIVERRPRGQHHLVPPQ